MKGVITGVAILGAILAGTAAAGEPTPDKAEVKRVVQEAYVDGIHNFRDVEAIRSGFHPGFEMLILRDGELSRLPIADWIASIEKRNATSPVPPDAAPTTQAEYPIVDVTGDVAMCKVELTREGRHVFTDYLLLYRFSDGWKIVGKAFHRH